ncbi:helix-turn-helix transcriptional regulator [Kibdelosporangium philippinense]|uniref:Helix-turn-helix transcriptional regulator n=1 Tax=Kibdelosporangium philippinense TaxID=211113 RepID=A0ABS8ZCG1_9PSEU|nr:helix-turn-helix transcriptional regulator [Kibdelosporangium philippinense]MCE7003522.1 helix-turn-helix transcriptional regulator [Kibdelosporangium philippinense]
MDRDGLADFLRRRREALKPVNFGFAASARRRTEGLRRDEVAGLAHISTDFYTRLEQRRGSRPSETTVAALGLALRLTEDELDHLYRLAGHQPPPRAAHGDHADPSLLRVLERLDTPAQIVSDLGVTLKQNPLAEELLGVQTGHTGLRRSQIYRWFTDPEERHRFPADDHETHSRSYTAHLRAAYSRDESSPKPAELVAELQRRSPEFTRLWQEHEVAVRTDIRKRILHPVVGLITLDCQILISPSHRQNLVIFTTTPGRKDAELLTFLSIVKRTTEPQPGETGY